MKLSSSKHSVNSRAVLTSSFHKLLNGGLYNLECLDHISCKVLRNLAVPIAHKLSMMLVIEEESKKYRS